MKDWTVKQERYLRELVPNRLGELAANLARIKAFSSHDLNQDAVASLIEESKFFIEWTAMDAGLDRAAELVGLQAQLARWQLNWSSLWADREQRMNVAEQAKNWSDRVLEMSGLLPQSMTVSN
jgi:hypothetical protein